MQTLVLFVCSDFAVFVQAKLIFRHGIVEVPSSKNVARFYSRIRIQFLNLGTVQNFFRRTPE